ncbi:MAG: hypothetical protein M3R63_03605 [Actinomycetota bacterium]|nr:hypothetical protein [Actinomycetota bacterium]
MVFADYNSFELTDENTRLGEWVDQLVQIRSLPAQEGPGTRGDRSPEAAVVQVRIPPGHQVNSYLTKVAGRF